MNLAVTIAPAEQFDDIEQQREAAKLGMWIFPLALTFADYTTRH